MKSYCNVTLAEFASEASQGRHVREVHICTPLIVRDLTLFTLVLCLLNNVGSAVPCAYVLR